MAKNKKRKGRKATRPGLIAASRAPRQPNPGRDRRAERTATPLLDALTPKRRAALREDTALYERELELGRTAEDQARALMCTLSLMNWLSDLRRRRAPDGGLVDATYLGGKKLAPSAKLETRRPVLASHGFSDALAEPLPAALPRDVFDRLSAAMSDARDSAPRNLLAALFEYGQFLCVSRLLPKRLLAVELAKAGASNAEIQELLGLAPGDSAKSTKSAGFADVDRLVAAGHAADVDDQS